MDLDTLVLIFARFLIDNDIVEKYMQYALFKTRKLTTADVTHDNLKEHVRSYIYDRGFSPESLISGSFLFSAAIEPFNYWVKISEKWAIIYEAACRGENYSEAVAVAMSPPPKIKTMYDSIW